MPLLNTIVHGSRLYAKSLLIPKTMGAVAKRNVTLVTPPRIRVSMAEKVVHGVVMTVGMIAVPVWILIHMEDYRNGNK